jgi:hypothetical protein
MVGGLRKDPYHEQFFGSDTSLWLIGVVFAKGMGSPWTIFFFIVRLSVPYEMYSSVDLDCLGLCLDE